MLEHQCRRQKCSSWQHENMRQWCAQCMSLWVHHGRQHVLLQEPGCKELRTLARQQCQLHTPKMHVRKGAHTHPPSAPAQASRWPPAAAAAWGGSRAPACPAAQLTQAPPAARTSTGCPAAPVGGVAWGIAWGGVVHQPAQQLLAGVHTGWVISRMRFRAWATSLPTTHSPPLWGVAWDGW